VSVNENEIFKEQKAEKASQSDYGEYQIWFAHRSKIARRLLGFILH